MSLTNSPAIEARTEQLFHEVRDANFSRTSRLFAILLTVQWLAAILVALIYSPYAWEGRVHTVHPHVWAAVVLGGVISSLPVFLALTRPTAPVTRYLVGIAQMMWSALLIHLTGGRIETHFHVFGSLAFLAFYRDWKVLVPATLVVVFDHLGRQLFWPESVYGVANPEWWRFLEHGFWVTFEDTILVAACVLMTREMRGIAKARADIEYLSARELRAVGQLAASVGHELRNPLAAVRNANAFIGKKIRGNGADPKVVQFTEVIERELDACSKIISALLDFARERPVVTAPTPLRPLVDEAISLVPESAMQLVNEVADDLPIPTVDKEQFRQVLINLIQNAVEAMEPRGSGKVAVRAERQGSARWQVTIEDDGPGIPPEVVSKMFEPLFTTKVKGTGLGLAIVAGIIHRHRGTIRIDSEIGRGTRVVIEWVDEAPAPRPPARAAASDAIAAGEPA